VVNEFHQKDGFQENMGSIFFDGIIFFSVFIYLVVELLIIKVTFLYESED
jgi:hypothetical protein